MVISIAAKMYACGILRYFNHNISKVSSLDVLKCFSWTERPLVNDMHSIIDDRSIFIVSRYVTQAAHTSFIHEYFDQRGLIPMMKTSIAVKE